MHPVLDDTVTIIGASGRNGRLCVEEALAAGWRVRAGSRDPAALGRLLGAPSGLDTVAVDGTDAASVRAAVAGVGGILLAHGDDARPEEVNYGTVRAALAAVRETGAAPRVVLMSGMSVTQRVPAYQDVEDWRRRAERLVRASGLPYTIVRPGWFDLAGPDDDRAVLVQGDRIPLGSMRGVRRRHIAQAMVHALRGEGALARTVELFSEPGSPVADWDALYAATAPDAPRVPDALDGVRDLPGLPWAQEPERVRTDLTALRG